MAFDSISPVMLVPIENKGRTFQSPLNVTLIFLSPLPSESIFSRSNRRAQKALYFDVVKRNSSTRNLRK